MITGKTIALTRWTIVGKIMSLLFNVLPRLVILEKEMETHSSILALKTLLVQFSRVQLFATP